MERLIVQWSVTIFGHSIRATLEILDEGLNVTLFGGCQSHIGCVTVAEPDGTVRSIAPPGHKEQVVCEKWAPLLAGASGRRCAMTCGVHYDDLTPAELPQVLVAIDELFLQVRTQIE